MVQILTATISGLAVGALFSFLKLPVPAPPTIAGVMGVAGIYLGFILVNSLV